MIDRPIKHRSPNYIDFIGKKFGKLTVTDTASPNAANRAARFWCVCECGQKCIKIASTLVQGGTISCGCVNKERRYQHLMKGKGLDAFCYGRARPRVKP